MRHAILVIASVLLNMTGELWFSTFVFFWIRDEAAGDGSKWAQDWEGLAGQKDGRLTDGDGAAPATVAY